MPEKITKITLRELISVNNFVSEGTPTCSSEELFSFAEKKWGPERKDFGGGHGFPGFL